ncbi:hypothetical protein B296_00032877 [Ensete ventricosum]|uniref:Integrase zinc-binding domain-containing protein n=1 Tax=Ensete ventricosum TaxID=4639 RepID=A0A426YS27_ENSVE|nr:hypothetical protein B296_00032877 [Ensete ventricosum]
MSQERPTPVNPGEVVPPTTQPRGSPSTPAFTPFVGRQEPTFPHPRVVLPLKVIFLTLRIQNFTIEASEVGLRETLDMLEECRAKAHLKTLHYQRAVAPLYNRRIRPRPINTGDLVLRKAEVNDPRRTRGKLVVRWEGPYHVT